MKSNTEDKNWTESKATAFVEGYGFFDIAFQPQQITVKSEETGESFCLATRESARDIELYSNTPQGRISQSICRQLSADIEYSNLWPPTDYRADNWIEPKVDITIERWNLSEVFQKTYPMRDRNNQKSESQSIQYQIKVPGYGDFKVDVASQQITITPKDWGSSFRLTSRELAKEAEFSTNNVNDVVARAICRQLPGAEMLFSKEEPYYDEDPYGNSVRRGIVTVERWNLSGTFLRLPPNLTLDLAEHAQRMKQFEEMKQKHPDALLLFRVGTTYETYKEDAARCAEILGVPLQNRTLSDGQKFAFAAFPHKALDTCLPKLVRSGLRVAICERPGKPKIEKQTKIITEMTSQTPKQEQQQTQQQSTAQAPTEPREPQMVTVNGDKVTHAHAFQSEKDQNVWYFTARINGEPLRAQRMSEEDVKHYKSREISVEQMMSKYFPGKVAPKVSEAEWNFPVTMAGSEGTQMQINKVNAFKEKNETSPNVGKWMFYADVDGQKMSVVADRQLLSAYFDRTATPERIVREAFGEKLHLASAYEKYQLPTGVKPESINIAKNPATNRWEISADLGEHGKTAAKELQFDDGFSFFRTKTATREQLAAKYLGDEITQKMSVTPEMSAAQRNSLKA